MEASCAPRVGSFGRKTGHFSSLIRKSNSQDIYFSGVGEPRAHAGELLQAGFADGDFINLD
jgi:hypothetical protein